MGKQTVSHPKPGYPPTLRRELHLRALRCGLWVALFHAQTLRLEGLEQRLVLDLADVDAALHACEAA